MKVKIEDIKIGARLRQEDTDVTELKKSIEEIGLLNPIIIDEQNELLGGFRRLHACKELGWTEIEATVVQASANEIKKLKIEYHENIGRSDLTPEDVVKYNQILTQLMTPPKTKANFWTMLKRIWNFFTNLFHRKDEEEDESGWL